MGILNIFKCGSEGQLIERTFKVEGMMCSHCELTVKNKISSIKGVKEVIPSSAQQSVVVKSVSSVSDQQIKDAIIEAGYSVVE